MPDGEGGFDGDGSVRWEVEVIEDDDRKGESRPEGAKGRRSKGVDKAEGTVFRIVLKVPEDGSAPAFLAQFKVQPVNGEIVLQLNREKRDKQIKVQWPTTTTVTGSQTGA